MVENHHHMQSISTNMYSYVFKDISTTKIIRLVFLLIAIKIAVDINNVYVLEDCEKPYQHKIILYLVNLFELIVK